MRAARAVPGGARPTAAPQGSDLGPYFGQISPLAAQLANERGYANAYGPFLPRPARTFTEGAFGPFSPILPVPLDVPPLGAELPDPRRFDYEVGWNLPSIPGQDGYRLASFPTLDSLSRLYSVARTCIERRKAAIVGLDWDIVPTKEASKAYQSDHDAMHDFGKRRAKAVEFFRQPDPDRFEDWGSFISALLEQLFVYDAVSLLLKPKRGRGLRKGILGSDLDSIELIDGSTIRPLLSLSGGRPRPPAPAYQQFLKGVPRSDLPTMWSGKDIEEAGLKGYEGPVFSTDQLIYKPIVPRINSPYGFSAVEMALIVIMTGLRKQAYQLEYYNEGSVPAVYLSPGDPNITPNQIRELQDALNAVSGDQAWHHKIIVTPPDSKVFPQRPTDLADQFDEIIMTEVAMVFDVDPMSLGVIPKVSTVASPFAAREMAQASRTVHERTSTKPLLKYLCDIFNTILHRVCGQDDMRFTFAGMDEAQDQAATTDLLVKQFQNGFISVDEAREELQRTPWGLPETSGPLFATQMGPVPLNQAVEMASEQRAESEQRSSGGNAAGTAGSSHQPRAVHHPPSSRPVGSHNPRQGLPSGSGMRTGLPSSGAAVSDTPAHTAARAHQAASRPAKAVRAELDALARHLRKGRNVATWVPKYLSGAVMATVAEDLTKGVGVEEAVRNAVTVALPPGEYEWAGEAVAKAAARQWPGWQKQQQVQQAYTQRVRAAFTQAAAQARMLIAQWLSGALAVTAAALAKMILAAFAAALLAVLKALWAEAWHMGRRAARAVLAGAEADWGGWEPGSESSAADTEGLAEWAASHGRQGMEWIEDTGADELAAYLAGAGRSGEDAETIAARITQILGADGRADLIADTEMERAEGAASEQVFRQAGMAYKEWLTENDAKVCPACRANARQGPIPFDQPFQDGSYWNPGHPRCVIGSTRVSARTVVVPADVPQGLSREPASAGMALGGNGGFASASAVAVAERDYGRGNIRAVSDREFVGDVITIRTAFGYELTVTPNHPIATRNGWVPGAELAVGDYVLSSIRPEWVLDAVNPDEDDIPPRIEDVAQSFPVPLGPMPTAPQHFHGDGAGSKVHVVRTDGLLVDHGNVGVSQPAAERPLRKGNIRTASARSLVGGGPGDQSAEWLLAPAHGRVGGIREPGAFFGAGLRHADVHAVAPISRLDASVEQDSANRSPADAEGFCERLLALSGEIALDQIVDIRRHPFSGHVYNLDTIEGWYIGNGIVTHNCRCAAVGTPAPDARKYARGRQVELSGQEYWPAGSYPHGPAAGGGAPMHAAHDASDTQEYIPGGVPGMTAGGEPPRWDGDEAPHVVQDYEPGTGRAGGSRGGGTVLEPYRDRSGEQHNRHPEDADDADWPRHRDVPPRPGTYWPAPYMDGYWPRGGIGTGQPPVTSIGATDRGRPPNPVGKSAADFNDANPVEAEHVYLQLARNFPADAISWVRRARWTGPQWVPWNRVDTDDEDKWAASHQPGKVNEFAEQIREHHGHVAPSVLVQEPNSNRAFIVDGHHRALARRKLGQRVLAYVGSIDPRDRQAAIETHDRQIHSGADPRNKGAEPDISPGPPGSDLRVTEVAHGNKNAEPDLPVAAGIAVRAADTGRILMLQRAFDEDDDAGGFWELPGGRLDDGESAFEAARREWSEEVGVRLPEGDLSGLWNSSNGRYRGFVLTVPSEDAVDILGARDDVDNPDGDMVESLAWWDPAQMKDNPAIRPELLEDVKRVRRALKSAETPVVSTVHHPLGHEGLWHTPSKKVPELQQLPAYFQNTARAIARDQGGTPESRIPEAVEAVREWSHGTAFGGRVHVTEEVQEAAQRAMNEWEELRASHAG